MSKPQTRPDPAASDSEKDDVSEGSEEGPMLDTYLATDSGETIADSLACVAEAMSSFAATFEKAAERSNKTNKILCKLLESIDDTLKRNAAPWSTAPQGDAENDSTNGQT